MKKTVKQRQPENERRRRDKRKRNRLSSNSITVMKRRKKVNDNFFFLHRAQKGDKVGEKGGAGGGGGDSPPEVDQTDDVTDDLMAENGEIPEGLSPVDRIPPKEPLPLPLPLPLAKKQSPVEREKREAGEREGGGRGTSRVARLPSTSSMASVSLSPGGVASSSGTTPSHSPRKAKKEDGWKEVGKRYANVVCSISWYFTMQHRNLVGLNFKW